MKRTLSQERLGDEEIHVVDVSHEEEIPPQGNAVNIDPNAMMHHEVALYHELAVAIDSSHREYLPVNSPRPRGVLQLMAAAAQRLRAQTAYIDNLVLQLDTRARVLQAPPIAPRQPGMQPMPHYPIRPPPAQHWQHHQPTGPRYRVQRVVPQNVAGNHHPPQHHPPPHHPVINQYAQVAPAERPQRQPVVTTEIPQPTMPQDFTVPTGQQPPAAEIVLAHQQQQQPVHNQYAAPAEVVDQQPPQPQHEDQQPPQPQHVDQQPPQPQHEDQQPPQPQHVDQQPPQPQHEDQQPPQPQHEDQQPPQRQHEVQRPPQPQHEDVQPAGGEQNAFEHDRKNFGPRGVRQEATTPTQRGRTMPPRRQSARKPVPNPRFPGFSMPTPTAEVIPKNRMMRVNKKVSTGSRRGHKFPHMERIAVVGSGKTSEIPSEPRSDDIGVVTMEGEQAMDASNFPEIKNGVELTAPKEGTKAEAAPPASAPIPTATSVEINTEEPMDTNAEVSLPVPPSEKSLPDVKAGKLPVFKLEEVEIDMVPSASTASTSSAIFEPPIIPSKRSTRSIAVQHTESPDV